jgi:RsmE family RNA methyltransferase
MIAGLEQARDTILPEILLRPLFKPFMEDELPALLRDSLCLVAHPGAANTCPRAVSRPVTLSVGPEGGFIPFEIEKFRNAGFLPVHCGDRILHVETAIPSLLARLF